jgi:hypothetical protein
MSINNWWRVAWVKKATDNNNIYLWTNGVSNGTIACGTNASSTSEWSRVTIGNISSQLASNFNFKGLVGGLRVSNTAVYNTAFTAPEVLTNTSSTALLLIDSFKERVGNVTFTVTGSINHYEQVVETAFDDSRFSYLDIPIKTTPKTTNLLGFYMPSSIYSSTEWRDMYGAGDSLTIDPTAWRNNEAHLFYLSQKTTPLTINTRFSSIRSIVFVVHLGVGSVIHKILISRTSNGNAWFSSPRADGGVWNSGVGGSSRVFIDGIAITSPAVYGSWLYSYKWSVVILNNLSLQHGDINLLGYSSDATWSPYVGSKLGAVAMYSQTLTDSEIASITKWGLQRFSGL